jgi:hypothetical protein
MNAMTGKGRRGARLAAVSAVFGLLDVGAMAALGGCSSGSHAGATVALDGGADATAADAALDGGDAAEDAENDGNPTNTTPGDCTYLNGVWYCGTGYGDFPSCPGNTYPNIGDPCSLEDGGVCLGCSNGVAQTFGCSYGSYIFGSRVGNECNH